MPIWSQQSCSSQNHWDHIGSNYGWCEHNPKLLAYICNLSAKVIFTFAQFCPASNKYIDFNLLSYAYISTTFGPRLSS